jgi:hypothetical protein
MYRAELESRKNEQCQECVMENLKLHASELDSGRLML